MEKIIDTLADKFRLSGPLSRRIRVSFRVIVDAHAPARAGQYGHDVQLFAAVPRCHIAYGQRLLAVANGGRNAAE